MMRWLGAAAFVLGSLIATPIAASAQDTRVIEGEIMSVNLSAGRFTIRHGPIRHLGMDAPSAVGEFKVADAVMLNAVQAGNKIRFTADRIDGQLTITAIVPGPAAR